MIIYYICYADVSKSQDELFKNCQGLSLGNMIKLKFIIDFSKNELKITINNFNFPCLQRRMLYYCLSFVWCYLY